MGTMLPESAAKMEQLKIEAPVGARYRHYKSPDKIYHIVMHAFIEDGCVPAIVYQADYGDFSTWIRPATVFFEMVEYDGKMVQRFTRID